MSKSLAPYLNIRVAIILTAINCVLGLGEVFAQNSDSSRVVARYGNKGFELRTIDNNFLLQIQGRLQFRFATPADTDPITYDDFVGERKPVFKINRARIKIGGHAFKPWLGYYWEYELSQSNLLDFRVMIEKWEWLNFKLGQWKVEFTRERFISSGEQQLIERSLINRAFTVDRQQGVEVYGHLKGEGIADFNYWAAALTGTGRGNTKNDDGNLMYFGRLQWNFLGREVEFEGSDLEITPKPAAILAVAAVTNRSPYTRFSQAGGGTLEGFEEGAPGQYRVNQLNIETAFKYRGLSWQSELHWKQVIDKLNSDQTTLLHGFYVQAGYMVHQSVHWWPKPLEFAVRHATYRPKVNVDDDAQTETSFDMNWFFKGHKNKLTAEASYFNFLNDDLDFTKGWRYRVQWDISF
ncbi:porin [Chryseolinea sp. T2]|uniref:porin n=1 Tax=Chryseolinea sp. T2 TaxID=3129255 RepID=UPI0030776446